tara:strand:- start:13099 stop:13362 length:264 start_codon:yes stop_codon:yes gene_type:complete
MDEENLNILGKKIHLREILLNIQKFLHNPKNYYFYEGEDFDIQKFIQEGTLFHNDLLTYVSNNQYGVIRYIYDETYNNFQITDNFMS